MYKPCKKNYLLVLIVLSLLYIIGPAEESSSKSKAASDVSTATSSRMYLQRSEDSTLLN